jgi:hypothetical protein
MRSPLSLGLSYFLGFVNHVRIVDQRKHLYVVALLHLISSPFDKLYCSLTAFTFLQLNNLQTQENNSF